MELTDTIKVFNHSNASAPVLSIYIEGEEAKTFILSVLRKGINTVPNLPPYATAIDKLLQPEL